MKQEFLEKSDLPGNLANVIAIAKIKADKHNNALDVAKRKPDEKKPRTEEIEDRQNNAKVNGPRSL